MTFANRPNVRATVPINLRVVEKGVNDNGARGEAHCGTMNGKTVHLGALAPHVRSSRLNYHIKALYCCSVFFGWGSDAFHF